MNEKKKSHQWLMEGIDCANCAAKIKKWHIWREIIKLKIITRLIWIKCVFKFSLYN